MLSIERTQKNIENKLKNKSNNGAVSQPLTNVASDNRWTIFDCQPTNHTKAKSDAKQDVFSSFQLPTFISSQNHLTNQISRTTQLTGGIPSNFGQQNKSINQQPPKTDYNNRVANAHKELQNFFKKFETDIEKDGELGSRFSELKTSMINGQSEEENTS